MATRRAYYCTVTIHVGEEVDKNELARPHYREVSNYVFTSQSRKKINSKVIAQRLQDALAPIFASSKGESA